MRGKSHTHVILELELIRRTATKSDCLFWTSFQEDLLGVTADNPVLSVLAITMCESSARPGSLAY